MYLYRAGDSSGNTLDFLLSSTRDAVAAKRFLFKTPIVLSREESTWTKTRPPPKRSMTSNKDGNKWDEENEKKENIDRRKDSPALVFLVKQCRIDMGIEREV